MQGAVQALAGDEQIFRARFLSLGDQKGEAPFVAGDLSANQPELFGRAVSAVGAEQFALFPQGVQQRQQAVLFAAGDFENAADLGEGFPRQRAVGEIL